jgi:hypothetical protein
MEYIAALAAVYLVVEKHRRNTLLQTAQDEQAYTGGGGPHLDPSGYYRDDHMEGRRVFGEQVDYLTAYRAGATTATAELYNRWTTNDSGVFNPGLNENRVHQFDFLVEVPDGWDVWWNSILADAERHQRRGAKP